jgi:hypothetical protein
MGKIIAIRRWGGAKETYVVVLGLILLILGLFLNHTLFVIGLVLLVVGLVLNFVPIGGTRRRYY